MADAWRLAIGTFTRIPITPPSRLDRPGRAIALAPLIALAISAPLGVLGQFGQASGANPWLVSLIVIAAFAWITRGLHLDGLADTADALGSGKPAAEALAIARQSDIGPFGVIALILALLGQVIGLATLASDFAATVIIAALASRVALVITCTPAFRAARPDGLGARVAGSVRPVLAIVETVVLLALIGAYTWWVQQPLLGIAACAGLLAGLAVSVTASKRFGGITGDTMGATIEVGFTIAIVVAALTSG